VGLVGLGELTLAELTDPPGMLWGMTTPTGSLIHFPEGYGNPTVTLAWADVEARLVAAEHYWLATTRPDGRPHVVPTDGVWTADGFYFGGHADTVHVRNLRAGLGAHDRPAGAAVGERRPGAAPDDQPAGAAAHDQRTGAAAAVIVEGVAAWVVPSKGAARELAAASKAKYGWGSAASYAGGVWLLRPRRVLAWNVLFRDATRFTFPAPVGPGP
jgi:hypothetical protein